MSITSGGLEVASAPESCATLIPLIAAAAGIEGGTIGLKTVRRTEHSKFICRMHPKSVVFQKVRQALGCPSDLAPKGNAPACTVASSIRFFRTIRSLSVLRHAGR